MKTIVYYSSGKALDKFKEDNKRILSNMSVLYVENSEVPQIHIESLPE